LIQKSRATASKYGYENVEFRLGEIENLPTEDRSVDVVISARTDKVVNCKLLESFVSILVVNRCKLLILSILF